MSTLTGGQALVASLRREGVDTVFALPGIQLDGAFDALWSERDAIRVVAPRHEQAAGYMADGYARTTGRPGVCMVVPGPGLLNATAALSTAYACSSPVVCLTGQIRSDCIDVGRGELHEIPDQLGLIRHLTKWAARGMAPSEIPGLVHEAFRQARSGRPRPVELEVPPDVLQRTGEVALGQSLPIERDAGDYESIEKAARALGRARLPLIVAGGGVLAGGAWDELRRVAELLEAPVILTRNAQGALPARHHLAHRELAMPELLPRADAVLAVGTRLLQFANQPVEVPDGRPFIRIDADPRQIGVAARPSRPIVADAGLALAALAERIGRHNRRRASRRDELLASRGRVEALVDAAEPQSSYGHALRASLPDDAIVVSDSTQLGYWADFAWPVHHPRTYLRSGYQGTLGYGYPTALGAAVGNPDRRVVSITGDGGFMFVLQELATAAQNRIGAIVVVFDDGAYGNVKRIQEHFFGGRTIASDLINPPFARLAELFGVKGRRAEGPDALRAALVEALRDDGPSLIEVPVGPMPMFLRHVRERLTAQLAAVRS